MLWVHHIAEEESLDGEVYRLEQVDCCIVTLGKRGDLIITVAESSRHFSHDEESSKRIDPLAVVKYGLIKPPTKH